MQTNQTIQSITYILGGAIMQMSHGIGNNWGGSLVTILGFFLFITGLRKLKGGLDDYGQEAVGILVIAALIGVASAFFTMIPFLGRLGGFGFAVAFALELFGLFKLRSSATIGWEGKSGVTLLFIAMGLAIVTSFLAMIPFVGAYIASFFALASVGLIFLGWMKVQTGILETVQA